MVDDLDTVSLNMSNKIQGWWIVNSLCLNKDKIPSLELSSALHGKNTDYGSVKLLGFTIDANLNWDQHIHNIGSKRSRGILVLRHLKLCVSHKVFSFVSWPSVLSPVERLLIIKKGSQANLWFLISESLQDTFGKTWLQVHTCLVPYYDRAYYIFRRIKQIMITLEIVMIISLEIEII